MIRNYTGSVAMLQLLVPRSLPELSMLEWASLWVHPPIKMRVDAFYITQIWESVTSIPFRMYSCFLSSVYRIGSRFTATLTRINTEDINELIQCWHKACEHLMWNIVIISQISVNVAFSIKFKCKIQLRILTVP